jgi:hypothetical protein
MNKPTYMQDVELLFDVRKLNKHATVNNVNNLASIAMLHASSVLNKPGTCPDGLAAIAYINANVETDCSAYMPMATLRVPYEIALALGVMHSLGNKVSIPKLTFDVDNFLQAEVFVGTFNKDEAISIYNAGIRESIYADWIKDGLIEDMCLMMRVVVLTMRCKKLCYGNDEVAANLETLYREMLLLTNETETSVALGVQKRLLTANALMGMLAGPLSQFYHDHGDISHFSVTHNFATTKHEARVVCGFRGIESAVVSFVISVLTHARHIKTLSMEAQTKYRNDVYATIGWLLYRLYDHSLNVAGTDQT